MNQRTNTGFTLIELMIVVAIVAIVASIASYNYGNYTRKANRTDGRTALTETATSLEKCRALYSVYNSANCNVSLPVTSVKGYYSVTAAFGNNGTTFTLTATPNGTPQSADADCTTLVLHNTGKKEATGANTADCW